VFARGRHRRAAIVAARIRDLLNLLPNHLANPILYRFYIYRNGHVRGYPVAGRLGRHRRVRDHALVRYRKVLDCLPPRGNLWTGRGARPRSARAAAGRPEGLQGAEAGGAPPSRDPAGGAI